MVMVKMLVEKGADMSIENQYGNTPVHTACLAGANDIVQYLIDNGSDVNYANHLKSTPLHFTLYNDKENVDLVNYLLSKGATLEAEDSEGATPLLVAATKGHQKAASIFKDGGADPNHYDKQGNNAVSLALRRGHTKLAQFLGGEGGVSIFSAPTTAPGKGSTKQPVSAKEAPKSPEAPKIKKKGGFFRKR
jgi:ankyrin repeat protein